MEIWAIVELMGHVKIAGKLTEEEHFGAKMGRVDIPTYTPCTCANGPKKLVDLPTVPCEKCHSSGIVQGFTTKFFGGASVYCITPVSEEVARVAAKSTQIQPVHSWEMPPRLLPAGQPRDFGYKGDGDCFDDDDMPSNERDDDDEDQT
jgi:hypothetical protein